MEKIGEYWVILIAIITPNNNDAKQQKSLVQQVVMKGSVFEHLIPEQMFSTPENPAYGVSAVKAIQLAAAQGQKIYRITQANLETALAAINLNSSTEQEIRDAVYAGKEVTTHTHKLNYQGMIVAGYIIEDPTNGTGAYKIASGEDGAWELIVAFLDFTISMISVSIDAAATMFHINQIPINAAGQKVLSGLTNVFLIASLFLDIYKIVNNQNCASGDAIDLVIIQSIIILTLFYASAFMTGLVISPVFIFISISLLSIFFKNIMDSLIAETCSAN